MKNDFKNNVIAVMHVYESQYVNSINFSITNNIDVVFLTTDLIVEIIKNIVENFIIVQMMFKCDYEQCDKNDYWFKNCRIKHFYLKKKFENRIKAKKNLKIYKKKQKN